MNDIPLSALIGVLGVLILLSAFFSSSETAMMAINRYRLRHLVKDKHTAAIKVEKLLQMPDRLIGLILFGNNLANMSAAAVATVIGVRLFGDIGLALGPFVLAIVFLIFAELMPKTVAALYPEKLAFPSAYILTPMLRLLSPFIWVLTCIANNLLYLIRIKVTTTDGATPLSREELHTVVREASSLIPQRRKNMLLRILELEQYTVDDIMIPSNELVTINVNAARADIIKQLQNAHHTRIPVYKDNLDNLIGILHMRDAIGKFNNYTPEEFTNAVRDPYFVPEGTTLNVQLNQFQNQKQRMGLVVDEYGVIKGIVTIEDILEEIIGEFTTDLQSFHRDIQREEQSNSYLISGRTTMREINRYANWQLPLDGPKTLNGVILEKLEHIPEAGISLRIGAYTIEIINVSDNAVKMARVTVIDAKQTTETANQDTPTSVKSSSS